jgi:AraC-like DNA-binding protein
MTAYVSLLAIPLIISGFVYFQSGRVLKREIIRANESLLSQVRLIMDSNLSELNRLVVELSYNPEVEELIDIDVRREKWRMFSTYSLRNDLRIYDVSNPFIGNLILYFNRSDLIVAPSGSNSSASFFDVHFSATGLPQADWFRILERTHTGGFIPIGDGQHVLFAKSFPLLNPRESYANVLILIDSEFFRQAVRNVEWLANGTALIIDQSGRTLISTRPNEDLTGLSYEALVGDTGFVHGEFAGRESVAVFTSSREADWKYVSVIPASVFWENIKYVRLLTAIGVVSCVILGGLAASFFLRRNYKPISDLTHVVEEQSGVGFDAGMNEYGFIEAAMLRTVEEKSRIEHVVESQKESLQASFISRLLTGRITGLTYIHESLSYYGISFASDVFTVVLIHLGEDSAALSLQEPPNDLEGLNASRRDVQRVVQSVLPSGYEVYAVEADGLMACLVGIHAEHADPAWAGLHRAMVPARQDLIASCGVSVAVAIGGIHRTVFGIPEAYREASQAMEYNLVMGIDGIVTYEDVPGGETSTCFYSLETEQQIMNHMRTGDYETVRVLITRIVDSNLRGSHVPVKTVKCLFFDMVNTVIKVCHDAELPHGNLESIPELRSLDEMLERLLEAVRNACRALASSTTGRNRNAELIGHVIDHIANRLVDVNLNISAISECFGITPDYLSRLFRSHTNESMLDFICKQRIRLAKQLLGRSESTIESVARETGYSSVNTFIRNFKKHEGVTPGRYRDLILNGSAPS